MSEMKTENEINDAVGRVDIYVATKHPGSTYEQGIRDAFDWILGDLSDEEFFEGLE